MLKATFPPFCCLLAIGCATGSVPREPPKPAPVIDRAETVGFRGEVERSRLYSSLGFAVPASAEQSFRALASAYEALGIDLQIINTEERLLGNTQLRARRTLGGTRLSRYFECGRSVAGSRADSYQLTIDIRSQILYETADSSRLVTWIRATAVPAAHSRDMPITCSSTGGLEERLLREVTATLPP